ncbi:MAG: hypothetical protein QOJ44_914 [Acidimicrobiaceae bacterium]|jgi:hypothetical protein|nr:hypothetical protein [Acidimicrobiaceae bacterium]
MTSTPTTGVAVEPAQQHRAWCRTGTTAPDRGVSALGVGPVGEAPTTSVYDHDRGYCQWPGCHLARRVAGGNAGLSTIAFLCIASIPGIGDPIDYVEDAESEPSDQRSSRDALRSRPIVPAGWGMYIHPGSARPSRRIAGCPTVSYRSWRVGGGPAHWWARTGLEHTGDLGGFTQGTWHHRCPRTRYCDLYRNVSRHRLDLSFLHGSTVHLHTRHHGTSGSSLRPRFGRIANLKGIDRQVIEIEQARHHLGGRFGHVFLLCAKRMSAAPWLQRVPPGRSH